MKAKNLVFIIILLFPTEHALSQIDAKKAGEALMEASTCSQCKKKMNRCKCFEPTNSNTSPSFNNHPSNNTYNPQRPASTYTYKGRIFTTQAARDAAVRADKEKMEQQVAEKAQRIQQEAANLRSQLKGTTSSANALSLKGMSGKSGGSLNLKGNRSAGTPTEPIYTDKSYRELSYQTTSNRPSDDNENSLINTGVKIIKFGSNLSTTSTIEDGVRTPINYAKDKVVDKIISLNPEYRIIKRPAQDVTDFLGSEILENMNDYMNSEKGQKSNIAKSIKTLPKESINDKGKEIKEYVEGKIISFTGIRKQAWDNAKYIHKTIPLWAKNHCINITENAFKNPNYRNYWDTFDEINSEFSYSNQKQVEKNIK